MKRVFSLLFISAITLFTSCGPTEVPKEEFSMQGIPRLAKYYGEPDANGDTVFHKVPAVALTNQYGDTVSTSLASGKISVVQLFFTSCEGICPVISGNMTSVQKAFAGNENVKMFSLSVDPARDSVSALSAYSKRFKCDSLQWNLLTGDKKLIYDYVRYQLRLPAVEEGDGGEEDFIHSDYITLIDREGIIRGYYTGTDTAQVRLLIEDIHTLTK
jgi:protein SCO1/2